MKTIISAAFVLTVLFAAFRAQAQSSAEASADSNRAIDAIDASTHSEVEGQPQVAFRAFISREQPTPLQNTQLRSATVFWPGPADPSDTESNDTHGMSSFRPNAGLWRPGTSGSSPSARNADSGQGYSRLSKFSASHPSPFDAKPSLNLRTAIPPVPRSDDIAELKASFGRAAIGLGTTISPFPKTDLSKYNFQSTRKRHNVAPVRLRQAPRPSPY